MRVAVALASLFILLALGGMPAGNLEWLGYLTLGALALGLLGDTISLFVRLRRKPDIVVPRRVRPSGRGVRPVTIIVDGSNVMHWNREPSATVLKRVVQSLVDAGHSPQIYFDANVGYKLSDRFMDAAEMAALLNLPPRRVTVVDKGTPADPVLLAHAARDNLRVVTNDRFTDWKVQYPFVAKRGQLVKGRWRQGNPQLRI